MIQQEKDRQAVTAIRYGYLLMYAANGAFEPFLAIFLLAQGFPAGSVGIIAGLQPFAISVATPMWTSLADRLRSHTNAATLSAITAAVICPLVSFASLSHSFPLTCAAVLAMSVARAPLPAFLDAAAMRSPQGPEAYGMLRIWGGLGYAVSGLVSGVLQQSSGPMVLFVLYPLLLISALVFIRTALSMVSLAPAVSSSSASSSSSSSSMVDDVTRFASRPGAVPFLLTVLLMGITHSVVNVVVPMFLSTNLHAPGFIIGLSLVFAFLSEAPSFIGSKKLIANPTIGPANLITAAHLGTVIRMGLYCLAALLAVASPNQQQPWGAWLVVALAQLLHGITFVFMWVSTVLFAYSLAPPGLDATAQGVVSALYVGLASGIGAPVGAWLLSNCGPYWLFMSTSLVAVISAVVWTKNNYLMPVHNSLPTVTSAALAVEKTNN